MMRSQNEIQTSVLKAARGAGFDQGQAQDIAMATRSRLARLAETAKPAAKAEIKDFFGALKNALDHPKDLPEVTKADGVTILTKGNPIFLCTAAIDLILAGISPVMIGNVPLTIFRAWVEMAETSLDKTIIWKFADGTQSDLIVTRFRGVKIPRQPLHGCAVYVPDDVWDYLSHLAAKILVPDTEQSRLLGAGAGAGLSDND